MSEAAAAHTALERFTWTLPAAPAMLDCGHTTEEVLSAMKPIVAIVGRPNVGKSTLFNRLIGQRLAIIEDEPGITRDRLYADCIWNGRTFTLVDTGGIQTAAEGQIDEAVTRQAQAAIQEADVVVFVCDVRQGATNEDVNVARILRRTHKPLILCVNKVENLHHEQDASEFYSLGMGDYVTVSAVHGMGTGDLLDQVTRLLPGAPEEDEEADPDLIRVAVVGRPNVGKSTLINTLVGEDRVIVSDIAGTTRDAIDVMLEADGDRYLLIDTAGMRRKARVDEGVERYSVMRSLRAVERADVVLLLIDAAEPIADQDQKIATYIKEQGKACVVVANKWDLVAKTDKTMKEFTEKIRYEFRFMEWCAVAFVSAKTGSRLPKLLPVIKQAWTNHGRRIGTGALNEVIREAVLLTPPPSDKGKRLKVYFATQAHTRPPGMVLFVNDRDLLHFSYRRYLENRLRETFDFSGTPLRWFIRQRESKFAALKPKGETSVHTIRKARKLKLARREARKSGQWEERD